MLAAASGLVVGNALQGRAGNAGPNLGGLVPDNPGGTIVNARAANTSFSLDAIEAVQAARGDAAYVDYGARHTAPEPDDETIKDSLRNKAAAPDSGDFQDYGQRHPGAGTSDVTPRRATAPGIDDFLDYGLRHPESESDADAAKESLAKPTLR